MNFWIILSVLSFFYLIQWYFDGKWKGDINSKYDLIIEKLNKDFSAGKIYYTRSCDKGYETYTVNTLEELIQLKASLNKSTNDIFPAEEVKEYCEPDWKLYEDKEIGNDWNFKQSDK